MALKIENEKIVGTIDKLEEKLSGEIPVTRLELIHLVNSWGRTDYFYTKYLNELVKIEECEVKECYDLSKLDVSQITNMINVFICSKFNGDISSWNMSSVTDMSYMFYKVENFNQPLNNWNTSNVIDMKGMFAYTKEFNSPLNSWNVSNVTNMSYMFYNTKEFNSNINDWDVSNVEDMEGMFYEASAFNQDISNWDVSNVTSLELMFFNAESFNQNIGNWDISNVTSMKSMFEMSQNFNQNISSWNLENIINSYFMFEDAKAFLDKYNNGNLLPEDTNSIKEWFNLNSERMNEIDIKENHGVEIDNFFSKFININIEANSIQKKEI